MIIELCLIFLYLQLLILIFTNNLIMIFIFIELIFLSLILISANLSFIFDDSLGSFLSLILLIPIASESAIGLILLINFFKDKGSILIQ